MIFTLCLSGKNVVTCLVVNTHFGGTRPDFISSFSVREFLDYNLAKNIILFVNTIISLSYPLNFAIYCGMSRSVESV